MFGGGGVELKVFSQVDDEVVDRAGGGVVREAPDVLQQLAPRDDGAFVLDEIAEQFDLKGGEALWLVGHGNLIRVEVDHGPAEAVDRSERRGSVIGAAAGRWRRASRLRTMLISSSSSNGFCR